MKNKASRNGVINPSATAVLREVAAAPGIGEVISVRAAKAHLSALLDLVAAGREITITSGGRPKARLVRAVPDRRKGFAGNLEHLRRMPQPTGGPLADDIIRADRDGRGC